jgi:hypothetical protein
MITKFARKEDFYNGTNPRFWWVVDAEGQTLGRMATKIAHVLRGKHKVLFSPHVDTGDFVSTCQREERRGQNVLPPYGLSRWNQKCEIL